MNTSFTSIWTDLQGVEFEQRYINVNGIRTRYLHAGERGSPALIFIHGTGGHAEAYIRNLEAHSREFDVYAIDMLGHGFTEKPDFDYEIPRYVEHLLGFIDTLGLTKVSLSGESLGGWVASHFAVTYPERLDKLVLNTASGDKVDRSALARIRELSQLAVEDPSWERTKTRLEFLMYNKSLVHDDLVRSRQAIYEHPDMKLGMKRILSMHTPEARERYALTPQQWAMIEAPVLVLWTDHDPTATVEVGEQLAAMIPSSRFIVMKNCGHWPQFEDAHTFNEIHIDFLKNG